MQSQREFDSLVKLNIQETLDYLSNTHPSQSATARQSSYSNARLQPQAPLSSNHPWQTSTGGKHLTEAEGCETMIVRYVREDREVDGDEVGNIECMGFR